ncbi:MAG: SulP family inorganic anion transporter [Anaerolineales bacterium]|nr:SulP family inorganic anion transporter [Anaerolineales bacterium]
MKAITVSAGEQHQQGLVANILSGLATSLFIVPTGLAYAQLAGVNPIYGLYAGIVPVFVAALGTGTLLMISTLTSSIALATGSVLQVAGIGSSQIPQALFTITFLVGVIMLVLGIARLGSIVNFVSNEVMTGFVAGAAMLIILGQEAHLTGYAPVGENTLQKLINWLQNISQWDVTTVAVSVAAIVLMMVAKRIRPIEKFAAILVLFVGTVAVGLFKIPVELVGDIATIPNGLPAIALPDFSLIALLLPGAVSVAFVALAQGAAVNTAVPNPDGSKSSLSRDFIGQGLGNFVGSFFQSMSTGGALSQTAVSVAAGAKSRLGGVFAGLWLGLIVLLFGSQAENVPLPVIGGMLVVIALELIVARVPSIRLVLRVKAVGAIGAMGLTFFSALFIPLQDTIFLGALLSLLLYVVASASHFRLQEAVRLGDGRWEMHDAPQELKANQVTVLIVQGMDFFAEVPSLADEMPLAKEVTHAVVILVIRDMRDATSTWIKWLEGYAEELRAHGNLLILADVDTAVFDTLRASGALEVIGEENTFPATMEVLAAEEMAWQAAQNWLQAQSE